MRAYQALGGIVAISDLVAIGLQHAGHLAVGGVGESGGLMGGGGQVGPHCHGEQAATRVIGVGGLQAIGGGAAGDAACAVVQIAGGLGQRVGDAGQVASSIVAVAAGFATRVGAAHGQGTRAHGRVVDPSPSAHLAVAGATRGVGFSLREFVAQSIVGGGGGFTGLGDQRRQAQRGVPLGAAGLRLGLVGRQGGAEQQLAGGVPGKQGLSTQEVELACGQVNRGQKAAVGHFAIAIGCCGRQQAQAAIAALKGVGGGVTQRVL